MATEPRWRSTERRKTDEPRGRARTPKHRSWRADTAQCPLTEGRGGPEHTCAREIECIQIRERPPGICAHLVSPFLLDRYIGEENVTLLCCAPPTPRSAVKVRR
ncbi:hypothetical protein MRX96_051149 [Rhipicephalus microplus]